MPGHDRTRIVGKPENELNEFSCGICRDILNHPMVTKCCRQMFCKECIESSLASQQRCPQCRKQMTRRLLAEGPRLVFNVIDSMQIRCFFSGRGCQSVHTIGQDSQHTDSCPHRKCRLCGSTEVDSEHNCSSILLKEKKAVTEENDKLKIKMRLLEGRNSELISTVQSHKDEICRLNSEVVKLNALRANDQWEVAYIRCHYHKVQEENTKLKNELRSVVRKDIPTTIAKAKGEPIRVLLKRNIAPDLEHWLQRTCREQVIQVEANPLSLWQLNCAIRREIYRLPTHLLNGQEWAVFVDTSVLDSGRDLDSESKLMVSMGDLFICLWGIQALKH